jgi:probable phosphoglycerate mutase
MTTHLYLIRHGDSHKQHNGIVGGRQGDSGLTPLGVRQVERLRDRLMATGEIVVDVLIASPLPRAWQTAEILAPALGLPIEPDEDFEEIRKGIADGLARAEKYARFGEQNFVREPFRPIAPEGEYWGSFALRAGAALERVVRTHTGKTVTIICHGGIVRVALQLCLGLPTMAPSPTGTATANASITCWRIEEVRKQLVWWLERYNDNLHLRGIETGESLTWERLGAAPVTMGASV